MIMQCTFLLLIVILMLSVKIEANKSREKVSKKNLDDKKLLKRNGEVADQQSSVDANTQALWEAYWKQYPENAWDATPDYYRKDNRANNVRQDFDTTSEFTDVQVASIIPGIAALLGVMALAWINANDQQNQQNQINELNDHQDSICTTVQALGNTQLAQASVDANGDGDTTDPADINVSAALNVIINQINNFATPTC